MQDRGRVAYTKIDQYNSNAAVSIPQNHKMKKGGGIVNDSTPSGVGLDNFFKSKQPNTKEHLSQSSGFSTFDSHSLKQHQEPLKLEQLVTLAIFKSTSGTIKKMLHGPTLRIYCVKEVPLANRNMREILKEWINRWEKLCKTEQYIRVHETFWNSPEGCVSIIQDFAANGSLANLLNSVGALPESILKQLAK